MLCGAIVLTEKSDTLPNLPVSWFVLDKQIMEAADVAESVKRLPCELENLSLMPRTKPRYRDRHVCNLSTEEVETSGTLKLTAATKQGITECGNIIIQYRNRRSAMKICFCIPAFKINC